jgi:hypothetical protein
MVDEMEAILEKPFLKFCFVIDLRNLPPFSGEDKNLCGYMSIIPIRLHVFVVS